MVLINSQKVINKSFVATVCILPQEVGQTCATGSPVQRYLYNPATRSCTSFSYLGCSANSNNFFSAQACEEFCMPGWLFAKSVVMIPRVTCFVVIALCGRGRPQYVTGGSVQTCSTNAQCSAGYECRPSLYGSAGSICCQTSSNIFKNRFSPRFSTNFLFSHSATVCSSPMDGGRTCSAVNVTPMQMFYYNSATRTCTPYAFSGCGGNANSFESLSECQTFCGNQVIRKLWLITKPFAFETVSIFSKSVSKPANSSVKSS